MSITFPTGEVRIISGDGKGGVVIEAIAETIEREVVEAVAVGSRLIVKYNYAYTPTLPGRKTAQWKRERNAYPRR